MRPGDALRHGLPRGPRAAPYLTTTSSSPAATAWWSTRKGSGSGSVSSAPSTSSCSAIRTLRRQSLGDCAPGQLVVEAEDVSSHGQHARRLGLADRGEVGLQHPEQPELDTSGHDGQAPDGGLGLRAQLRHARQHGVDDGGWNVHVRCGGQHLRHEEGVALRQPEEVCRIDLGTGRQGCDPVGRQRGQPQPYRLGPRHAAEQVAQRMPVIDLVIAIGEQKHRRQVSNPATEKPEHVERRTISPMHVIDHQERGCPRAELGEHGREHGVLVGTRLQGIGERPVSSSHRVAKRPQGARRQQVLAGRGEHTHIARERGEKLPDQAGLADPRVTQHQGGRTVPRHGSLDEGSERAQFPLPFQQVVPHRAIVALGSRSP